MKNILTGRIDHLNFENGKTVRNTQIIRATRIIIVIIIFERLAVDFG
jgi:hypothetical protein